MKAKRFIENVGSELPRDATSYPRRTKYYLGNRQVPFIYSAGALIILLNFWKRIMRIVICSRPTKPQI
jgi:hypothetical protein